MLCSADIDDSDDNVTNQPKSTKKRCNGLKKNLKSLTTTLNDSQFSKPMSREKIATTVGKRRNVVATTTKPTNRRRNIKSLKQAVTAAIAGKSTNAFTHEENRLMSRRGRKNQSYDFDRTLEKLSDDEERNWASKFFGTESCGFDADCFKKFYEEEVTTVLKTENPDVIEGALQCRKCKSRKIFTMSMQIRRSDEPTTVFAVCTNNECRYRWREN